MLSNKTKEGRKMSTRRLLYNMYCTERGDRDQIQYIRFNINLNRWFTYSQIVDFETWDDRRFKPQNIVGLRKE